ncbi:DUF4160 domain-containing protein [Neorhizobium galegae]|nr:DUF4160 domain-containing protein [Neorhizobium galegae]KAB1114655.1 DUF4160 domain-containing protein [Neorhizobium galegae]
MFADDHHPPHFHIVTPDHEVLVRLSDLETLAGSIDRQSLHRALAWVRKNRKVLNEAWERLNER